MSDHLQRSIADLQTQITADENRLRDDKRLVNRLCEKAGLPPLYQDADFESASITTSIRPDEFYGRPLATVIREVLQKRRAANSGPASVPDIYESLKAGGYEFNTKNDENAKRGLYISLSKNTSTFHKLPNGMYGLLEWYPAVKEPKQKDSKKDRDEGEEDELLKAAYEEAEMSKVNADDPNADEKIVEAKKRAAEKFAAAKK